LEHRRFSELPNLLRPDDLLVLNDTRVIAARISGRRFPTGGKVEVLLLRPATNPTYDTRATRWLALVKPGRTARPGDRIEFDRFGSATVEAIARDGMRVLALDLRVPLEEFLNAAGRLPLPPYVRSDSERNQEDYQTIFGVRPGSVAAPTAALHFTERTFSDLERRGIETCTLTLQVGLATFRPMRTPSIDAHEMHVEAFDIPIDTARRIDAAKNAGRRVVAVGTTVVRALEAAAEEDGTVCAGAACTGLFITPGFRFRVVDALLTNFHLPRSTLLVLVSAFAGRGRMLRAYEEAVRLRYRFFSFGDAMLIF